MEKAETRLAEGGAPEDTSRGPAVPVLQSPA